MTRSIKFKIKKYKKKIIFWTLLGIVILAALFFASLKFSLKNFVFSGSVESKINISIDKPFLGELYLKSTLGEKTFSEPIIYSLEKAKKSIEIAVYSINIPEIVSLLEEKRKSGVEVTVIVPENKMDNHIEVFKDTGIKVISLGKKVEDDEYGEFMHHKYILIDYGTPDAKVFFGSTNFTSLQEKYDLSFLLEATDPSFIEPFKKEIDLLKDKHKGTNKFFQKTYAPFAARLNYTNGFVEIWMSPGYKDNSVKKRILDLIEGAESKIEIMAWRFNDKEIFEALARRAKEGLEIKIIADDFYFWSEPSKVKELLYLSKNLNKNIEVISDSYNSILMSKKFSGKDPEIGSEFNSFMHHHTMIIDGKTVVTGTNNWGINGFFKNDESVMVTDVDWMVESFGRNFHVLYSQLKGDNLNYNIQDFDVDTKRIMLKGEYPKNSKFIIYKEKSYPDVVGEICLEGDLNTMEIMVSKNCLGDQTRMFTFDENYFLLASSYIK